MFTTSHAQMTKIFDAFDTDATFHARPPGNPCQPLPSLPLCVAFSFRDCCTSRRTPALLAASPHVEEHVTGCQFAYRGLIDEPSATC